MLHLNVEDLAVKEINSVREPIEVFGSAGENAVVVQTTDSAIGFVGGNKH